MRRNTQLKKYERITVSFKWNLQAIKHHMHIISFYELWYLQLGKSNSYEGQSEAYKYLANYYLKHEQLDAAYQAAQICCEYTEVRLCCLFTLDLYLQTLLHAYFLLWTCSGLYFAQVLYWWFIKVKKNLLPWQVLFRGYTRGRHGRSGLPKLLHFSLVQAQGEVVLHKIYRKSIFQHYHYSSLQKNYRKAVETSPCFKFVQLSLVIHCS